MNKNLIIHLFLVFVLITRFDSTKADEGEGNQNSVESGGKQCECCDGEGIKCGIRLNWCGSKACNRHDLYFCDKNNKKAYEYELCKNTCIVDQENNPDYCSIKIDKRFLFINDKRINQIKKQFNENVNNFNSSMRSGLSSIADGISKSFEVSDKERKAVILEQERAEKKQKLEQAKKKKLAAKGNDKNNDKDQDKGQGDAKDISNYSGLSSGDLGGDEGSTEATPAPTVAPVTEGTEGTEPLTTILIEGNVPEIPSSNAFEEKAEQPGQSVPSITKIGGSIASNLPSVPKLPASLPSVPSSLKLPGKLSGKLPFGF